MEHTALLWFGLMVVFILVEASTVTMLSVWFVIGALAAMVTSLLGGEIWLQAVIFLTVSAVMLLALRPLAGVAVEGQARRHHHQPAQETGLLL